MDTFTAPPADNTLTAPVGALSSLQPTLWRYQQQAREEERAEERAEDVEAGKRATLADPTAPFDETMLAELSTPDPDAVSGALGPARGRGGDSEVCRPVRWLAPTSWRSMTPIP